MQSRNNYLSRSYQKSILAEFSNSFKKIKITLNQTEQGHALYHKISREIEDVLEKISNEPENNQTLLEFFAHTKKFLKDQIPNFSSATGSSSLFFKQIAYYDLIKMIKLCEQKYNDLINRVEINIYQVRFPKLKNQEATQFPKFYYKDEYESQKLAMLLIAFLLFSIESQRFHWLFTLFIFKVLIDETSALQGSMVNHGYVFSLHNNIPGKWIYGRINVETEEYCQLNHHRDFNHQLFDWSNYYYVLDCRDPQTVFTEGINYFPCDPLFNPSGHIIFFDTFKNALNYARSRSDGFSYDNNLGWKLGHSWSNDDRKPIKKAVLLKTPLPESIAETIDQYYDYQSERLERRSCKL